MICVAFSQKTSRIFRPYTDTANTATRYHWLAHALRCGDPRSPNVRSSAHSGSCGLDATTHVGLFTTPHSQTV